ncbi:MAG: hypothetical protein HYT14_01465, partial [Candidatus Liptonbacteria bacterium]|nr:hypothetical protein [Candidatus Liptonbacteria bacterium]
AETAKAGDIAVIIGEAEKISAIKVAGKPEDGTTPFFEWGGAVYVPQVQKSKKARDFVGEVRSFITRFAEAREASREAYREQVAPYMIGTKRRGGADKNLPSEHQALRHAKDTLRAGAALTRFLDGEGARVFVPVVLDKRGGAKPETVGELLLERDSENEKRPVIRRIVGRAFLAKLVFAKTDRVTKEVTGWVHEVRVEFAPKPSEELRRELAKKGQEPFLFRGPITVAQALTRRFIAEEAAVSRDKALALLAKEYKAKTLTAKNAAKFAAETGGEGTYALPLNWNRAPAGIVVKKTKAGVLALIASTDVSVERLFRTESEEEEPSNHKMGELSGKMKALMRSALWEVGVLRDDVPAHLQPESRERE